jgi:hypothetical protein
MASAVSAYGKTMTTSSCVACRDQRRLFLRVERAVGIRIGGFQNRRAEPFVQFLRLEQAVAVPVEIGEKLLATGLRFRLLDDMIPFVSSFAGASTAIAPCAVT